MCTRRLPHTYMRWGACTPVIWYSPVGSECGAQHAFEEFDFRVEMEACGGGGARKIRDRVRRHERMAEKAA